MRRNNSQRAQSIQTYCIQEKIIHKLLANSNSHPYTFAPHPLLEQLYFIFSRNCSVRERLLVRFLITLFSCIRKFPTRLLVSGRDLHSFYSSFQIFYDSLKSCQIYVLIHLPLCAYYSPLSVLLFHTCFTFYYRSYFCTNTLGCCIVIWRFSSFQADIWHSF